MNSKSKKSNSAEGSVELGRGEIKDNFLAALVTSKAYRVQVVKAKKGESYLIAA